MSDIIFTCPETGQEVSTGIDIDPESLGTLLHMVTEVPCPACNQIHGLPNVRARLAAEEELTPLKVSRRAFA